MPEEFQDRDTVDSEFFKTALDVLHLYGMQKEEPFSSKSLLQRTDYVA